MENNKRFHQGKNGYVFEDLQEKNQSQKLHNLFLFL